MKAFHVNWTTPFTARFKSKFHINDYEIIITILSALKWRDHNGPIKLYTDSTGLSFYKKLNLLDLWDGGIDTEVLDSADRNIDPVKYWSAGKLICLEHESLPAVMLDTDLIVFDNIEKFIQNKALVTFHRESIKCKVYSNKDILVFPENYQLNTKWNWSVSPCNTALLYLNDLQLKAKYIYEAMRFMENNFAKTKDDNAQTVFAEQRILAMVADELKVPVYSFLVHPYTTINNIFFHTWNTKRLFAGNQRLRIDFCLKWLQYMLVEYPEMRERIEHIESLTEYLSHIKDIKPNPAKPELIIKS